MVYEDLRHFYLKPDNIDEEHMDWILYAMCPMLYPDRVLTP